MLDQFYSSASAPIQEFNAFVVKHSLKEISKADHICFKCGSVETFESVRKMLEFESDYIHQAIISKRRIAYIKLKRPFETDLGPIYFLELSDQKPDGSQVDGFDHIELYPTKISYSELVTKLEEKEKVVKVERPHHTTHDIELASGFLARLTTEPLVDKIKREEMK